MRKYFNSARIAFRGAALNFFGLRAMTWPRRIRFDEFNSHRPDKVATPPLTQEVAGLNHEAAQMPLKNDPEDLDLKAGNESWLEPHFSHLASSDFLGVEAVR